MPRPHERIRARVVQCVAVSWALAIISARGVTPNDGQKTQTAGRAIAPAIIQSAGDPLTAYISTSNFDDVTPPALPPGFSSTVIGQQGDAAWVTSSVAPYSPPNDVFAPDPDHVTDNRLMLGPEGSGSLIKYSSLRFKHFWDLENGYDGGVLEISIDGAAYVDIQAAG